MPTKLQTVGLESGVDNVADRAAQAVKDIDAERRERMARNKAQLDALGLQTTLTELHQANAAAQARAKTASSKAPSAARKQRTRAQPLPLRRSHRLAGVPARPMVELDDDGKPIHDNDDGGDGDDHEEGGTGLLDLLNRGAVRVRAEVVVQELNEEQRAAIDARRCSSKSRGSVYDKVLGLTCHFCRQKKLCGEVGCPRCSARDSGAACIGKSSCPCCGSATGIFCRACLSVRYGQDLDRVRLDPNWLCPHCYMEKHGPWQQHGWFCNSSVCMRQAGLVPTGIAIHQALAQGYASVAHMLQAAVLKKRDEEQRGGAPTGDAAAPSAAAAGPWAPPASSSEDQDAGAGAGGHGVAAAPEDGVAEVLGDGSGKQPQRPSDHNTKLPGRATQWPQPAGKRTVETRKRSAAGDPPRQRRPRATKQLTTEGAQLKDNNALKGAKPGQGHGPSVAIAAASGVVEPEAE